VRARVTHGVALAGAVLGAAALLLQFWLLLGLTDGLGAATWRFLGYFTLIGNTFAVFTLALAALGHARPRRDLAMAAAMLLIGITYSLLLRHIWAPQGWQMLADRALHDVMPLLAALYWLLRPHRRLAWRDAGYALLLPVGFTLYAMARGAADGWYPYPFMDVAQFGATQVAINCSVMGGAFGILALLLVWLDRRLP